MPAPAVERVHPRVSPPSGTARVPEAVYEDMLLDADILLDAAREASASPPGSGEPEDQSTPIPLDRQHLFGAEEEHSRSVTTPTIEPFPGLSSQAVPKLDQEELLRADLDLTPREMFLLSRIDGHLTMDDLQDVTGDPLPSELLSLVLRLWRIGLIRF